MAQDTTRFENPNDSVKGAPVLWPPIVIPKEDLGEEIVRLAEAPAPADGRRESLVVHPLAEEPGLGLAPGISVRLSVLNPGERTKPIRHNDTIVDFCIQGGGTAVNGGRARQFTQYDVWTNPAWMPYSYLNDTDSLQVRLTYSNVPLLEKLNIRMLDEDPPADEPAPAEEKGEKDPRSRDPFGSIQLSEDGATLVPYETLISPPAVESRSLMWRWQDVKAHLDKLGALGKEYVGRRLYLLYNPITGRTNGTTPSFFAAITIRPPKIVDRPHRHTSAAVNYYFAGLGHSIVEGKRYDWKAGDLMLSAPGWAIHNHVSHDEPVYEFTIQDQPFTISQECILWQENLKKPPVVLGAKKGAETNRAQVAV